MSKTNNPIMPVPTPDSADTLSALLQLLPIDASTQLQETIGYLKVLSDIQQEHIIAADRQLGYGRLIFRAIQGLDVNSPSSIAGLYDILAGEQENYLARMAPSGSFDDLESKVLAYLESPVTISPQAPLPDFAGLAELVEMFKEQALINIKKHVEKVPTPDGWSPDFARVCRGLVRDLGTYNAFHTWTNSSDIYDVFATCLASHKAARILCALIDDPKSTHPQRKGKEVDFNRMSKRIRAEIIEGQAFLAVAALSPEDTLRAVALLQSEQAATSSGNAPKKSSP